MNKIRYEAKQNNYQVITGQPIAYWAGSHTIEAFQNKKLVNFFIVRNGISTGDNDRYLRLWYEVDFTNANWHKCNKGGSFRKWYGNNEYYIFWKDDGYLIRSSLDEKGRIKARLGGIEFTDMLGVEMSRVTSGSLSFRISLGDFVYESSTNDIYSSSENLIELKYLLGYCNSKPCIHFLDLMNPTINIMPEDLRGLPFVKVDNNRICAIVDNNINISREDWDSFETSWDFKKHPLI